MSMLLVLRATLLAMLLSGALLLGRATAPRRTCLDTAGGPTDEGQVTSELESARIRLALLSRALELGTRSCPAPIPARPPSSDIERSPGHAPPAPHPIGAHDDPEERAASDDQPPETYLRALAQGLPVPLTPESLVCTIDSCRMEVDLRTSPERYAALQTLVARAAPRLPQSVIEPDATGAKVTVTFPRGYTDLASATGGDEVASTTGGL